MIHSTNNNIVNANTNATATVNYTNFVSEFNSNSIECRDLMIDSNYLEILLAENSNAPSVNSVILREQTKNENIQQDQEILFNNDKLAAQYLKPLQEFIDRNFISYSDVLQEYELETLDVKTMLQSYNEIDALLRSPLTISVDETNLKLQKQELELELKDSLGLMQIYDPVQFFKLTHASKIPNSGFKGIIVPQDLLPSSILENDNIPDQQRQELFDLNKQAVREHFAAQGKGGTRSSEVSKSDFNQATKLKDILGTKHRNALLSGDQELIDGIETWCAKLNRDVKLGNGEFTGNLQVEMNSQDKALVFFERSAVDLNTSIQLIAEDLTESELAFTESVRSEIDEAVVELESIRSDLRLAYSNSDHSQITVEQARFADQYATVQGLNSLLACVVAGE